MSAQSRDSDNESEGNYDASRRYDKKLEKFVTDRRSEIPELAEEAERAVDGPDGDELRKAEEIGKSKARR